MGEPEDAKKYIAYLSYCTKNIRNPVIAADRYMLKNVKVNTFA